MDARCVSGPNTRAARNLSASPRSQESDGPSRLPPLRQQFRQCLDKFWVPESFNADDALVAYVNQHQTGIRKVATYATVSWPL